MACILVLYTVFADGFFDRRHKNQYNRNRHSKTFAATINPYEVLGIQQSSSSAPIDNNTIARNYRDLCLRYHPDKNRHLPEKERNRYEAKFKQVQEAYSLIGTEEARKRYDAMYKWSTNTNQNPFNAKYSRTGAYQGRTDNPYEEMLRRMFEQNQQQQYMSPFRTFSANTMDSVTSPFSWPAFTSLKSIYVHKVNVPLQDLYTGKRNYELKPTFGENNFFVNAWKRYTAAFRGGIGLFVLYQAFLVALPLWRFSRIASAFFALYIFDRSLPVITKSVDDPNVDSSYVANILPGYKGGTKFTFHSNDNKSRVGISRPTNEIVFEICEAHHNTYRRKGNNLYATVAITEMDAKEGCTVDLIPLAREMHSNEDNGLIHVNIPKGTKSGDTITVQGFGWPIRSRIRNHPSGSSKITKHGDLIVTVQVPTFLNWKRWKLNRH